MKIHDSNRQVDLVKQDFAGCSFILERESIGPLKIQSF